MRFIKRKENLLNHTNVVAVEKMRHRRMSQGLTIVELFVVIVLIGFFLLIVSTATSDVRVKARDAKRVNDINEVVTALNIYYINNQNFPISIEKIVISGEDTLSQELLEGDFIKAIPKDPKSPIYNYEYISNGSGSEYEIIFCIEGDEVKGFTKGCGNIMKP